MLKGTRDHFSGSSEQMPELDIRIILTVDQRFVTIDEAHALLPNVPEHSHHGTPCIGNHNHHYEPRHHVAHRGLDHGHGVYPPS